MGIFRYGLVQGGLKKITKESNVNLIDLALDENKTSKKNLELGMKDWFLKCDGHWNENGHAYAVSSYLKHINIAK